MKCTTRVAAIALAGLALATASGPAGAQDTYPVPGRTLR